MKQIVLVSQSTNPSLTNDHQLQLAAALTIANRDHFAPAWKGAINPSGVPIDPEATFSVAAADAGLPDDAIPALTQDTIDGGPGILGYHDVEGALAVIRIGLTAILQNGGTLLIGANSWAVTEAHEGWEALADLDANEWVLMADGKTKLAYEAGDPVEGNAFPIDVPAVGALPAGQVWMSNFVLPAYFNIGAPGPYDYMGLLKAPLTMDDGGYQILMDPDGTVRNVFARTVEEGGMPQWRRDVIALKSRTPGSRHHKRHHGHRLVVPAGGVQ